MITVAAKSCQSMVEMNVWRVCEVIVDLVGRARKIEKAVEKGVVWEMDGGGRCLWVLNSTKKKKNLVLVVGGGTWWNQCWVGFGGFWWVLVAAKSGFSSWLKWWVNK